MFWKEKENIERGNDTPFLGLGANNQVDDSSNLTQPNPKFVGSRTCVGWVWLKFLKKKFIIQVVGSTIGKPIEPNPTNYYHLIFTQKEIYTYLCCIYIKLL